MKRIIKATVEIKIEAFGEAHVYPAVSEILRLIASVNDEHGGPNKCRAILDHGNGVSGSGTMTVYTEPREKVA